jgi:hypothetical protein
MEPLFGSRRGVKAYLTAQTRPFGTDFELGERVEMGKSEVPQPRNMEAKSGADREACAGMSALVNVTAPMLLPPAVVVFQHLLIGNVLFSPPVPECRLRFARQTALPSAVRRKNLKTRDLRSRDAEGAGEFERGHSGSIGRRAIFSTRQRRAA